MHVYLEAWLQGNCKSLRGNLLSSHLDTAPLILHIIHKHSILNFKPQRHDDIKQSVSSYHQQLNINADRTLIPHILKIMIFNLSFHKK